MKLTDSRIYNIFGIIFFTAALLFGFLINEREWFELCFQSRIIEDLDPVKTDRKPVAKQTVMFIYDDLSNATAERNLTRTKAKAEKEGFVSKVNLDSFTFTIAGVYTLGTGDQPSLVQVKSDFLSEESVADNIFENVQITGKKTFHIGEALWIDNFKRGIDDSFTSRDLGLFVKYGTDKMMAQFRQALANKENGLITVHMAETGHVSHKVGVYGEPLRALHRRLESELLELTEELNDGTTWLVLSDHGTTERGQHGGISKDEQTSFLWAFGQGIKVGKRDVIAQVDIGNIVAFLTGAPLLSQNCGVLPNIFTDEYQVEYKKAAAELLRQKQILYTNLKQKFGDNSSVDINSLDSLTRGVNRIKFDTGASSLLLPKILTTLLLIVFLALSFKKEVSLLHLLGVAVSVAAIVFMDRSYSWLTFGICAGALASIAPASVARSMDKRLLKPVGVAVIAMVSVSSLFYWFPSQIYLKQTAAIRGMILYTTIAVTLVGFFLFGIFTVSKKKTGSLWSPALFGVGAGFIVATPCRYYLFVVPLGYILLLGLGYYHREQRRIHFLGRIAKALPLLAVLIFAVLCQIPELELNSFRKLPLYLKDNSWSAELIFAASLLAFGVWINRSYRGRHSVLHRGIALGIVFCLHLLYQCKLIDSNALLSVLFFAASAYLGVLLVKEKSGHRDYWQMAVLMALMTQQQTGAEFALVMGSTFVFRWMYKNNPYEQGSNTWYVFNALLIAVYFIHFLGVQGQHFSPNNFMILKGFVGFRMPLVLPLSVSLIVFYYLQPVLLSWLVVRMTVPPKRRPMLFNTAVLTVVLFFLKVVFTNLLFSYSLCPGDTYIGTSAGTLIIMSYGFGLAILAALSKAVFIAKNAHSDGD